MIDPKLNVASKDSTTASSNPAKNKEAAARLQKVSAGLSVNDTVAANGNPSVGAQGVDTSGVNAGAGAGAGMTRLDSSASSVPEIVPGSRGSGTTTAGASSTQAAQAAFPEDTHDYSEADLSQAAYEAWCDRGCPEGSPEVDWQTAVERVGSRRTKAAGA